LHSGYSKDLNNIGNLHHGEIDVVLTSPPYAEAQEGGGIAKRGYQSATRTEDIGKHSYMPDKFENEENISRLPFGNVDAVITSPPYSNIARAKQGAISPHMQGLISKLSGIPIEEFAHDLEKLKEAVKLAQAKIPFKYSDNEQNIGNLAHGKIDTVITSPPYENSLEATSRHTKGGIASRDPKLAQTGTYADMVLTSPPYEASVSKGGEGPTVTSIRNKSDESRFSGLACREFT